MEKLSKDVKTKNMMTKRKVLPAWPRRDFMMSPYDLGILMVRVSADSSMKSKDESVTFSDTR